MHGRSMGSGLNPSSKRTRVTVTSAHLERWKEEGLFVPSGSLWGSGSGKQSKAKQSKPVGGLRVRGRKRTARFVPLLAFSSYKTKTKQN